MRELFCATIAITVSFTSNFLLPFLPCLCWYSIDAEDIYDIADEGVWGGLVGG